MKLFSVLFLSLPLLCFSQFRIVGKLISKSTGEPIPYAAIIDIGNNQSGTTSNESGEFKLLMPSGTEDHRILISMVAYQDTILLASQLMRTTFPLRLNETVQQLEDVVYAPGDMQYDIGQPFGPIKESSITNPSAQYSLTNFVGTYIHKRTNQKGTISSISVCIAEKGYPTAPFIIRVLKLAKGNAKNMRLDSLKNMIDIFPEPILVQAEGSGWMEINVSSYNVELPEKNFYVVIVPIDNGSKYIWRKGHKNERYGITVASYQNSDSNIQYAQGYGERMARIKRPKKHTFSPAIAISYLAPKSK